MNPFIFLRLNPILDKLPVELCMIVISACTESHEILHIAIFFSHHTCAFFGINSQNSSILRSPKFVCIVSDYTPYSSSSSPYHFGSSKSFPTNTETIMFSLLLNTLQLPFFPFSPFKCSAASILPHRAPTPWWTHRPLSSR